MFYRKLNSDKISMEFKWLLGIVVVLFMSSVSWAQNSIQEIVQRGVRLNRPQVHFKKNNNPAIPSFGYSSNCGGTSCLPANTRVYFSDYEDVNISNNQKLRVGHIREIITPDGKRQNVSGQNYTLALNTITTSGFLKKTEVIAPIPETGDMFVNFEGRKVDWAIPLSEDPDSSRTEVAKPARREQAPSVSRSAPSVSSTVQTLAGVPCELCMPDQQAPGKIEQLSRQGLEVARRSSTSVPQKYDDFFLRQARRSNDPIAEATSIQNYNEYKEFMWAAAKEFNLDPALLFCLKHQESRESQAYIKDSKGNVVGPKNIDWHARAVSGSGAVGLGQFLPGTAFDINTTIPNNNPGLRSSYSRYLATFNKSQPAKFEIQSVSFAERSAKRGSAYARYVRQRNSNGLPIQVSLVSKNISDRSSASDCDDRCDPVLAIGQSAMYLRYIIDNYGNKLENRSMNLEYKVFIAGAYNRGPGAISKAITDGTGPLAWQKNLEGTEVQNHMNRIRNCMKVISN